MEITKDTLIAKVLEEKPQTANIFLNMGMHCLGCPISRGENVGDAANAHGVDIDELLKKLNEA